MMAERQFSDIKRRDICWWFLFLYFCVLKVPNYESMHFTNTFQAKASFNGKSIQCIAKVKDGKESRYEKQISAIILLKGKFCN